MRVVVIGAGPAGMMAAGYAARSGADVILLERNSFLGKKLSITGKGRGNLTNNAAIDDFIPQYPENGSFLYSALHRFTNEDLCHFFHETGVPTVVERGGRVFPASQQAADLVGALQSFIERSGVRVYRDVRATAILAEGGKVKAVACGRQEFNSDAVVLATGGASYTATGSTGDGYRMAALLGHTVITPQPALVPLETAEPWVREAMGLSLRNVSVRLLVDGKISEEEFGEMLFTHYGVSGPAILTLSRKAVQAVKLGKRTEIEINLKPALHREQLEARILRDFTKNTRKQYKNSLDQLLPGKLIKPVIGLSGIDPETPIHQVTRQQRERLVDVISGLKLTISKIRPLNEAIVTAGGVSTREVDPRTMGSRLVQGLFFAGEILDVDGNTGGYNLQAAFSTGYLAGNCAAGQE